MTREEAKRTFEDLRGYKIILSDLSANEQQELWNMAISALSTDVRPNIHGHWKVGFGNTWCSCSECGGNGLTNWSYCPWCGAGMRGNANE